MQFVSEAPVFHPSENEFINPMKYIDSIREQAQHYGICKIVPPTCWKSPFALDPDSFQFRTRIQNVTKIDGVARIEREFLSLVRKYLFRAGTPLGTLDCGLPLVPAEHGYNQNGDEIKLSPVRLYRLFVAVQQFGGGIEVISRDLWPDVVTTMFPWLLKSVSKIKSKHQIDESEDCDISAKENLDTINDLAQKLRACYERILLSFFLEQQKSDQKSESLSFDMDVYDLLTYSIQGYAEGLHGAILGELGSIKGKASAEDARKESYITANLDGLFQKVAGSQDSTANDKPSKYSAELESNDLVNESRKRKRRSRQQNQRYSEEDGVLLKKSSARKSLNDNEAMSSDFSALLLSSRSAIRSIARRQRQSSRYGKRELPDVHVGIKFYRFYKDIDQVFRGYVINERFDVEFYDKYGVMHHTEKGIDFDTLQMLIASGETEKLAREALIEGICQECFRADYPENMLLCDGCNYGYHVECLESPLRSIPSGDWFCTICMSEFDGLDYQTDLLESSKTSKTALLSMRKSLACFGYGEGEKYRLDDFRAMGELIKYKYFEKAKLKSNSHLSIDVAEKGDEADKALEFEYWRFVSDDSRNDPDLVDMSVSYGSDLDTGELGSGFPTSKIVKTLKDKIERLETKLANTSSVDTKSKLPSSDSRNSTGSYSELKEAKRTLAEFERYAHDGWNLGIFPKLPGSLLKFVDEDITGVIVPWLYIGMFFSSFCWHTEDHYFASINYHHFGAPKTWYGVPSSGAPAFENAARKLTPELFEAREDILTGIVTQYNPTELARHGTPVYHLTQRPGEFVVTFPQAYHGGFNHGYNCAEAVNFATFD